MNEQRETQDGAQVWSQYWSTGQQHSIFSGGAPVNTEGYWRRFFDTLPEGASVLDLACGAGALTRQAAAHRHGFGVTGADYAAGLPAIEGVRLDSGVRLESLPYETDRFDAVVSQFGVEYSALEASLGETARVLAPGGRFAFMCHAEEGRAVQEARARVTRLEGLLAPGGLVEAVQHYGRDLAAARTTPPDPKPVAEVFRAAAAQPGDETTTWCVSFLAEIMTNALRFEPAYVIDNAAHARKELSDQSDRLALMIAAARDSDGMAEMAALAEARGLAADRPLKVIDLGGAQIAWWLAGTRAER